MIQNLGTGWVLKKTKRKAEAGIWIPQRNDCRLTHRADVGDKLFSRGCYISLLSGSWRAECGLGQSVA